jgi:hypothetical protein
MVDFSGVDRKIKRANHQINNLQDLWAAFRERNAHEIVIQRHPKASDRAQLVLKINEPIASDLMAEASLQVGDAIHNLRSALDHLAYQWWPNEQAAFPIPRKRGRPSTGDYKSLVLGKVQGAPKAVRIILLSLQPYEGGDHELLWAVSYLDNVDKHRLLIAAFATYTGLGLSFSETFGELGKTIDPDNLGFTLVPAEQFPLHDGYVLYDAPIEQINKQQAQPTIEVSLAEPEILKGQPVTPALTQLSSAVASVIDLFR